MNFDVSVQAVPLIQLFDSLYDTLRWVSPFGYLRITGYLLLPEAFRSLSRPSSAPDAKAFPLRSYQLDLVEVRFACSAFIPFRAECSDAVGISSSNQNPLRWAFDLLGERFCLSFRPQSNQLEKSPILVLKLVELCRLINRSLICKNCIFTQLIFP